MRLCSECGEGLWLTETRTPVFPAPLDGGPSLVIESFFYCPNEQCAQHRVRVPVS